MTNFGRVAPGDRVTPQPSIGLAPVRRAGQLAGRRRQWSRDRVWRAVLDWADELGVAPYAYEWDRDAARKIGRAQAAGVHKWVREYSALA